LFYGLATEGNDTALEGSPLYNPKNRSTWATYDPGKANRLLDAMGLTAHDDDGHRRLPNGRPMSLVVEDPGDDRDWADALALVREDWRKIGIELLIRHAPREIFYERVRSGEAKMSVFFGAENGLPTPDSSPADWAPTSGQQLQWSQWGSFTETHGKAGRPIEMPVVRELLDLYRNWNQASSEQERALAWRQMLAINADQVFVIGLVAAVPQPVVVRNSLHNVPRNGIYNWDPGALFGIYRPDQFWFGPDKVDPRG
jgi:peptide/nickel transport system substrate-binding protein